MTLIAVSSRHCIPGLQHSYRVLLDGSYLRYPRRLPRRHEADDMIGALATRAGSAGLRTVIASRDSDMQALMLGTWKLST